MQGGKEEAYCSMRRRSQRSRKDNGGAKRDRTADLLRARQALSQLSYGPKPNNGNLKEGKA
jgi:hypothetical protein